MPWDVFDAEDETHSGTLSLQETAAAYIVTCVNDVTVTLDRTEAALSSYIIDGKEMVVTPLIPNFWRVPTDNDEGNSMASRQGTWKNAGPNRSITAVDLVTATQARVQIRVQADIPAGDTTLETLWTVYADGTVEVANDLEVFDDQEDMPRFGIQMEIAGDVNNVQWYGRGPQETYWDRQTGAAIGIYSSTVEDWIHEYVRPQENANRTGVRWLTLTRADGYGLEVTADDTLYVSAWPYTMAALESASHVHELARSGNVTVNLDYKQLGVGGDNSWGARMRSTASNPGPTAMVFASNRFDLEGMRDVNVRKEECKKVGVVSWVPWLLLRSVAMPCDEADTS